MAYDTAMAISVAILSIGFAYIAANIQKDKSILQFLFLFMSLGSMLMEFGILWEIADANAKTELANLMVTGYMATQVLLIVFILFTLLYFLKNLLEVLSGGPKT